MKFNNYPVRLFVWTLFVFLFSISVYSQTSAFTYQGKLTDGVTAATGTYQMQFKLFDALSTGAQIGSTITNNSVTVASGVFTVNLDFGSSPFAGADRWLEISVKKAAEPSFTTLTPRQQITSSPYSLKTLSATSADSLSATCVLCVTDAKINTVSGSKVTGTVPNATTATTAGNVTGTVAIANGGTGATSAANARTNLGLGTLATVSPMGAVTNSTFLRSDGQWQPVPPGSASGLAYNPTTLTDNFTINPADNFTIYQVNRCGGGPTNVTLPTAASAGAGRVFYVVNVVPACVSPNLLLHIVLQGFNWIEYSDNFVIQDKTRFAVISNGVDGWLLLAP